MKLSFRLPSTRVAGMSLLIGIASLVPLPRGVLIGMRTVVFAPLILFLFAQILLPLTRPSSAESAREIDSE